ncbi:MAG: hypothetical protein PHC84_05440 [Clostridia bacterium]|nr:hypothetical protein [Clostridia bacterium]
MTILALRYHAGPPSSPACAIAPHELWLRTATQGCPLDASLPFESQFSDRIMVGFAPLECKLFVL